MPTLESLGIPSPAFIRKLRKPSDWGGAETVLFDLDTPENSVYLVSDDMDLYLCIAALNAKRHNEDESLQLVYITLAEFQQANLNPFQIDDEQLIYCRAARKLHHGIPSKDQDEKRKIGSLVDNLLEVNRPAIRLKRAQAKRIVNFLSPLGCASYKANREAGVPITCKPCSDRLLITNFLSSNLPVEPAHSSSNLPIEPAHSSSNLPVELARSSLTPPAVLTHSPPIDPVQISSKPTPCSQFDSPIDSSLENHPNLRKKPWYCNYAIVLKRRIIEFLYCIGIIKRSRKS